MVALRIELSATQLSAEFGQPALDYRSCFKQSSPRESNPHPRRPKLRVLPSAPQLEFFLAPREGIEPYIYRLKACYPAVRRTGQIVRCLFRFLCFLCCFCFNSFWLLSCLVFQVAQEAIESSFSGLQPDALPFKLPSHSVLKVHRKSLVSRLTPGFCDSK